MIVIDEFIGLIFSVGGVDGVGFHFDVLLDFIVVIFVVVELVDGIGIVCEFVLEEFPVGERGEFLTELHILRIAVVVTLTIESFVLGFIELRDQVIPAFEKGDLRTLKTPILLVFGDLELRSVCLYFLGIGPPRIQLGPCLAFVDFLLLLDARSSFVGNLQLGCLLPFLEAAWCFQGLFCLALL